MFRLTLHYTICKCDSLKYIDVLLYTLKCFFFIIRSAQNSDFILCQLIQWSADKCFPGSQEK